MSQRSQMLLINFYSASSLATRAFHISPITKLLYESSKWSLLLFQKYLNLCTATYAPFWLISILVLPNTRHTTLRQDFTLKIMPPCHRHCLPTLNFITLETILLEYRFLTN